MLLNLRVFIKKRKKSLRMFCEVIEEHNSQREKKKLREKIDNI